MLIGELDRVCGGHIGQDEIERWKAHRSEYLLSYNARTLCRMYVCCHGLRGWSGQNPNKIRKENPNSRVWNPDRVDPSHYRSSVMADRDRPSAVP